MADLLDALAWGLKRVDRAFATVACCDRCLLPLDPARTEGWVVTKLGAWCPTCQGGEPTPPRHSAATELHRLEQLEADLRWQRDRADIHARALRTEITHLRMSLTEDERRRYDTLSRVFAEPPAGP